MKLVSVLLITSLILHRGRAVNGEVHVDEYVGAGGHYAVGGLKPSNEDSKTTQGFLSNIVSTAAQNLSYILKPPGKEIKKVVEVISTFYTSDDRPNEKYWKDVQEQTRKLVQQTIDESIIRQTNEAVRRLSEDLREYLDAPINFKSFSALDLCSKIDTELVNILSTYAGIHRPETVLLSYLDMATTRLTIWQTTALQYINKFNITGEDDITGEDNITGEDSIISLLEANSVCLIVKKWSLVYETEINKIETVLRSAIISWKENYVNKLNMICEVSLHGEEKTETHCRIRDEYNDIELNNWTNECGTSRDLPDCPQAQFVCFDYCSFHFLYPIIHDNFNDYDILNDHINNMASNFLVVKESQLDVYMKECNIQ